MLVAAVKGVALTWIALFLIVVVWQFARAFANWWKSTDTHERLNVLGFWGVILGISGVGAGLGVILLQ